MLSGDHKRMQRGLWINVFKGHNLIILVQYLRRYLLLDNFAEKAAAHIFMPPVYSFL
jgi:hypothetical protein